MANCKLKQLNNVAYSTLILLNNKKAKKLHSTAILFTEVILKNTTDGAKQINKSSANFCIPHCLWASTRLVLHDYMIIWASERILHLVFRSRADDPGSLVALHNNSIENLQDARFCPSRPRLI